MRDIFKFEKLPSYPHMKPRDVEIWNRFLEQFPDAYDSCQYDFNVGDPPPFNTLTDDEEDWNQDALYRLKIDVVARHGSEIDICEVKPNAGPSAIGQVKSYKTLYVRDEDPLGRVNMTIITDVARPNMEHLCKAEGINLVIV